MSTQVSHARRNRGLHLLAGVAVLGAIACARQPSAPSPTTPVMGFFMGFVHGFLILFSFLASLVSDVRIYTYPNAGGWYDFGGTGIFVIGVCYVSPWRRSASR